MNKIIPWLRAARLRTLPLALSCVVITAFMARYYNAFDWNIFIWATITTILLQVLANFANDYGDTMNGADNDSRVGPERMVQSGAITTSQMKNAIIITIIMTLVSGVTLLFMAFGTALLSWQPITLFVLGIASIIAALKYTAGNNPYGYMALGDLSVFLFFGLLGVLGNLYLYTHSFQMSYLWPAISIGAFSVAVLNLNNMRDRIEDKKVGKMTLPVYLGQKGAKQYHIAWLLTGAACAIYFSLQTDRSAIQFLYLLPLLILTIHAIKVIKTELPKDFDPELKKVALSTFLFSILFGIGLIF